MISMLISDIYIYTRVDQKRGTSVQVVWGWEYGTGHFDGGGWVAQVHFDGGGWVVVVTTWVNGAVCLAADSLTLAGCAPPPREK